MDYEPEETSEVIKESENHQVIQIPETQEKPQVKPILERLKPRIQEKVFASQTRITIQKHTSEEKQVKNPTIKYGKAEFSVEQHNSYQQNKILALLELAVKENKSPQVIQAIAKVATNISHITVQSIKRQNKTKKLSPSRIAFLKRQSNPDNK